MTLPTRPIFSSTRILCSSLSGSMILTSYIWPDPTGVRIGVLEQLFALPDDHLTVIGAHVPDMCVPGRRLGHMCQPAICLLARHPSGLMQPVKLVMGEVAKTTQVAVGEAPSGLLGDLGPRSRRNRIWDSCYRHKPWRRGRGAYTPPRPGAAQQGTRSGSAAAAPSWGADRSYSFGSSIKTSIRDDRLPEWKTGRRIVSGYEKSREDCKKRQYRVKCWS